MLHFFLRLIAACEPDGIEWSSEMQGDDIL